ncbi:MAG: hypothetical protein N3D78_02710 [Candidatus Aenigmarchaeota archaeon]|nr:hypothetical protein [Candidatus Pacearchaeota archaeon]MCX8191067.1 hypothetical protein [Candidatus Aenigmarchaeota archaeon]
MELLIFVEKKNYKKVEELLKKDDIVSGASIKIRDASDFGKEGFYFLLEGTEEKINKAKELSKNLAMEVVGKEKEGVVAKIKEEEEKAIEGFGFLGI